MTDEFPNHTQKGTDRVREFFAKFGLRSARMKRERSDDE